MNRIIHISNKAVTKASKALKARSAHTGNAVATYFFIVYVTLLMFMYLLFTGIG
jgi:glycopeptide antibiotics resistance protein